MKCGLVLTSGGARGAYQAGALSAIAEITKSKTLPFQILSGVSAGGVNCAYLAAGAENFDLATSSLAEIWSKIKPSDVFLTDSVTLTQTGIRWISDLGFGEWLGSGRGKSLLVTSPFERLLETHLDFKKIAKNIEAGHLSGIALTATNYSTGRSVTFIEGKNSSLQKLDVRHVMASAAIPLFFPAVLIDGTYYGDGCVRLYTPLSPAVHMGADRILAIGVRQEMGEDIVGKPDEGAQAYPLLADISGVLLNAMFSDALEFDVERIKRSGSQIPVMLLRPSVDLSEFANDAIQRFPYSIRHFLKGLGVSSHKGMLLMSYLAFDSVFTSRLVEQGYKDAMAAREELLQFVTMEGSL